MPDRAGLRCLKPLGSLEHGHATLCSLPHTPANTLGHIAALMVPQSNLTGGIKPLNLHP